VYGQDCGAYKVTISPTYSFLSMNDNGGVGYTNELSLYTTDFNDIGVYPVTLQIE